MNLEYPKCREVLRDLVDILIPVVRLTTIISLMKTWVETYLAYMTLTL